jgi:hypothetical protein
MNVRVCARYQWNLIRVAGQVKEILALTELDLECNLIEDLSEAGIGPAQQQ